MQVSATSSQERPRSEPLELFDVVSYDNRHVFEAACLEITEDLYPKLDAFRFLSRRPRCRGFRLVIRP